METTTRRSLKFDSPPALREDGSRLSFRSLLEAAYRVAAKVTDCRGQRVGLMLEKAPGWSNGHHEQEQVSQQERIFFCSFCCEFCSCFLMCLLMDFPIVPGCH